MFLVGGKVVVNCDVGIWKEHCWHVAELLEIVPLHIHFMLDGFLAFLCQILGIFLDELAVFFLNFLHKLQKFSVIVIIDVIQEIHV